MKECLFCKKEIDEAAKKCPYCQSDLSIFSKYKNIIISLFILLFFFYLLTPKIEYYFFTPDFSEHKNDISLSNTSMRFKENDFGVVGTVLGEIVNNTPYEWKKIIFEVSFYDQKDQLIDSVQTYNYDVYPSGQPLKFKLETSGLNFEHNEYDRFEVKVVDALYKEKWDYF